MEKDTFTSAATSILETTTSVIGDVEFSLQFSIPSPASYINNWKITRGMNVDELLEEGYQTMANIHTKYAEITFKAISEVVPH